MDLQPFRGAEELSKFTDSSLQCGFMLTLQRFQKYILGSPSNNDKPLQPSNMGAPWSFAYNRKWQIIHTTICT